MGLFKKDKFYKIGDEYIKVSKIWQMSTLQVGELDEDCTPLYGIINGRQYMDTVPVSQYRPEFRWPKLVENKFFKEYSDLYEAFLEYNNL